MSSVTISIDLINIAEIVLSNCESLLIALAREPLYQIEYWGFLLSAHGKATLPIHDSSSESHLAFFHCAQLSRFVRVETHKTLGVFIIGRSADRHVVIYHFAHLQKESSREDWCPSKDSILCYFCCSRG